MIARAEYLEARSLGPSDKQPLLMKLRTYKSDLSTLKKEAKEAKTAGGASARNELFGDAEDPFSYGEGAGQRERLLNTTARLDRTSERIKVRIPWILSECASALNDEFATCPQNK